MIRLPRFGRAAGDPVIRARSGDRGAFSELHARYAPIVHAALLARLPPQDAAEQVQEVFLCAWQRLEELRDPGAFGGWILQIARNRAVDVLRARRPSEPLGMDHPAPDVPLAEARQVLDAIRSLPEAYRETLVMRLVEGLTGPEIAERTGLTPGSVRVNLCRGTELLRERLGVGRE
ncbi:MAG: sigma-70 family RNA polymerase sigma factor [Myxococcota bacterium]